MNCGRPEFVIIFKGSNRRLLEGKILGKRGDLLL